MIIYNIYIYDNIYIYTSVLLVLPFLLMDWWTSHNMGKHVAVSGPSRFFGLQLRHHDIQWAWLFPCFDLLVVCVFCPSSSSHKDSKKISRMPLRPQTCTRAWAKSLKPPWPCMYQDFPCQALKVSELSSFALLLFSSIAVHCLLFHFPPSVQRCICGIQNPWIMEASWHVLAIATMCSRKTCVVLCTSQNYSALDGLLSAKRKSMKSREIASPWFACETRNMPWLPSKLEHVGTTRPISKTCTKSPNCCRPAACLQEV